MNSGPELAKQLNTSLRARIGLGCSLGLAEQSQSQVQKTSLEVASASVGVQQGVVRSLCASSQVFQVAFTRDTNKHFFFPKELCQCLGHCDEY